MSRAACVSDFPSLWPRLRLASREDKSRTGSNPGHPARLTPYYKVLQDAVRCYLVMLHCSDCNGYKALATGYNTK